MIEMVESATGAKPLETYLGDINLFAVYENESLVIELLFAAAENDVSGIRQLVAQGVRETCTPCSLTHSLTLCRIWIAFAAESFVAIRDQLGRCRGHANFR